MIAEQRIGEFCIVVTGEMRQPYLHLWPKQFFFVGRFDIVKFNHKGNIHGQNFIAN